MDFDTLVGGLNAAIADGLVYERRDGELSLFCYGKLPVSAPRIPGLHGFRSAPSMYCIATRS